MKKRTDKTMNSGSLDESNSIRDYTTVSRKFNPTLSLYVSEILRFLFFFLNTYDNDKVLQQNLLPKFIKRLINYI